MKGRERNRHQYVGVNTRFGRAHHEEGTALARRSRGEIDGVQAARPGLRNIEGEPDGPASVGRGVARGWMCVNMHGEPCHFVAADELGDHHGRVGSGARVRIEMEIETAALWDRCLRRIHLYTHHAPRSLC